MRYSILILGSALLALSACSDDSDSTGSPSQHLFQGYAALVEGGYVAHLGKGYAMSSGGDVKDCDLGTPITRGMLDSMMATWGGSILVDSSNQFCAVINGGKHCLTRLGEVSYAWQQWSPPGTMGATMRIDVLSGIDDTHRVAFRSQSSLTPSAQAIENVAEVARRDDGVTIPGHCPAQSQPPLNPGDLDGHWQGHRIIYDITHQTGSIETGHSLLCTGHLCDLPTDGLVAIDLSHFYSPGSWKQEPGASKAGAIMSDSGQSLAFWHCVDTGLGHLQFNADCSLYAFSRLDP